MYGRCFSSVHTLLPYDYYSLKFCKPKGGVKPYSENLGEFLRGDRIENSAYEVSGVALRKHVNFVLFAFPDDSQILILTPVERSRCWRTSTARFSAKWTSRPRT